MLLHMYTHYYVRVVGVENIIFYYNVIITRKIERVTD